MILIADAGSTKTVWAAISNDGSRRDITTTGINAVVMDAEAIRGVITGELHPALGDVRPSAVRYYGAGCIPGAPSDTVGRLLRSELGCDDVEVASDLLGAARALCGHSRGIVCILGTGSNSCLFDGSDIVDNVPPLGFILGDEGSGARLGLTLVSDILKRQTSRELADAFFARYGGLTAADIIASVYRRPGANSYLASFVPFIADNIGREEVRRLVTDSFRLFLRRNVANYASSAELPVSFTGSVAAIFADQLRHACEAESLRLGKIERYPLEGMVNYHLSNI